MGPECPECLAPLVDMGRYFRPPPRRNTRGREQLRRLAEPGIRFGGEGRIAWKCFVLGSADARRLNARLLIERCGCPTSAEGLRLLRRIDRLRSRAGKQRQ